MMEITPKRYLRRWRGYEKLDGSSTASRRNGKRVKMDPTKKKRLWKIKIMPKLKILRRASPKKFLVWLRDSYVNMMMNLANSRAVGASGYGGSGFGSGRQMKEYDEKMLVEIYKTILMAQSQGKLMHHDTANKLPAEPAVVSVYPVVSEFCKTLAHSKGFIFQVEETEA